MEETQYIYLSELAGLLLWLCSPPILIFSAIQIYVLRHQNFKISKILVMVIVSATIGLLLALPMWLLLPIHWVDSSKIGNGSVLPPVFLPGILSCVVSFFFMTFLKMRTIAEKRDAV